MFLFCEEKDIVGGKEGTEPVNARKPAARSEKGPLECSDREARQFGNLRIDRAPSIFLVWLDMINGMIWIARKNGISGLVLVGSSRGRARPRVSTAKRRGDGRIRLPRQR